MTQATRWLEGYLRAWRTKAPEDVRALFAEEAEYWFRPDDDDPVIGVEAIVEMWSEPEPTEAIPDLRVLIEDDRLGIITGTVDYPGHESYSNMWEVWFGPDGRAVRFVEWFMTPPDDDDAAAG